MRKLNEIAQELFKIDSKSVEALLAFNALVTGLYPNEHMSKVAEILHSGVSFMLLAGFMFQMIGCWFYLYCGMERLSVVFRRTSSAMRLTCWLSLVCFLFLGVEGITRAEIRYLLFFIFESWVFATLIYRGEEWKRL